MEASIRGERKKVVVVAVLLVTVFLSLWWGATYLAPNDRNDQAALFFAERLQKIESEEIVVVEGTSYTVHGGSIATSSALRNEIKYRVLSLAYLKILTERSPFLSLAGTDPRKLTDALLQLADTAASLAAIQESSSDNAFVSSALYPLSFLTALAEAEQARLTFLVSGRDTDADNYASTLARSANQYKRDLITFKKAFEQAVPVSVRPYATEQEIISRENSLKALDDLYAAMTQTQSLIERRARCIRGKTARCNTEDEAFAQLPTVSYSPPSSDAVALASRVRGIIENSGVEIPSHDNPMVTLGSSVCIKDSASTGLFFVLSEKGIIHVGDIRLLKTDTYRSTPFYKYFYDRNVAYVPTYPFSYYKCPEIAEDVGRFLAVRAVRMFAYQTPLSSLSPTSDAKTLGALERKLASSTLIHESDAIEYLALAQKIAAQQALPPEMALSIASLSLQTRDRSAGFDHTIDRMAQVEKINLSLLQKRVPVDLAAPYLFFVRSGFPSLLLAGNTSATEQRLQMFPPNDVPLSQQPFTAFSSLADNPDAVAEVEKGMKFFETLHNEP